MNAYAIYNSPISILIALFYLALALFVFFKGSKRVFNIFFFAFCLSLAILNFGLFALKIPIFRILIYLGLSFIPSSFFCFVLHIVERDQKRLLSVLAYGPSFILASLFSLYLSQNLPNIKALEEFLILFFAFLIVSAHYLLFDGLRRATKEERRKDRLELLFFGGTITTILVASDLLYYINLPVYPLGNIAAIFFVGLSTYTLIKYQFLEFTLGRSFVHNFISIFITANFIISILAFERVLRLFLGYETFLPTILLALLAGVVLHPLRRIAQVFTDKVFFKEEYSAHQTLRKFTKEIISIIDLDELLFSIVSTIKKVMRLEEAYIMLYEEPQRRFASRGLKQKIALPKNSPLIEYISKMGEKILKTETEEKRFDRKLREDFARLEAELVFPLICKNELLGLLALGKRRLKIPYSKKDIAVLETLCDGAAIAIENAGLYEKSRLHLLGTIKALAATIEAKDPLTIGHCEKVAVYSAVIAKEFGMSEEKVAVVRMGAYLHDIGKIGIAEKILFKPGRLTMEEFSFITQHPLIGLRIIEPINPPKEVADIIKYHHERVDGKGYPKGLKGKDIPLCAKIVACADSFEVMTTGRVYKREMNLKDAIFELRKCSGTQFDPEVVGVFIKLLKEKDLFLGEKE